MNKAQVKNIIDGMPDGMDIDDYLVELVNRSLFAERHAIIQQILAYWTVAVFAVFFPVCHKHAFNKKSLLF